MTALSAIFTMNSVIRTDNLKLITIGLFTCVLTFYLKDLSLALGKTDRIPMTLAVWSPVLVLSLFTLIEILQINENSFVLILCCLLLGAAVNAESINIKSKNISLDKNTQISIFENDVL